MKIAAKNLFEKCFSKIMILGMIATTIVSCGENRDHSATRKLSFSISAKTDSAPFYARYATDSGRILVGEAHGAQSGAVVSMPEGHQLYMVEYVGEQAPKVDSEIFRDGRIVFYAARDLREATLITNQIEEFAHPREVNLQQLKQPSSVVKAETTVSRTDGVHHFFGRSITIDPVKMREDLESLSGARAITIDGQTYTLANRATTDNKTKARAWLKQTYEALGFVVSEHRYATGVNFIAEKSAQNPVDDNIIMVSGHLDTVQTAGADDDGSGVVSSLSVARAIATLDLQRTVRFVAFDEEERGLIGSARYAAELARIGEISKVSLFNIEMTGFDSNSDGAFHAIDCNENTSSTLTQAVSNAIVSEGIALRKVAACTNRSDHAAFWEHDRPAIVVSQNFFGGDSNPCYHRTCDNVSKVNWDYMSKMTKVSAVALVNLIGAH